MKTGMMRKIAVLVTGLALALSFPVAGAIADQGGVPHNGTHGPQNGSQGKGKPDNPGSQGKGKGKQHKQNGLNGESKCPDPFPGLGNRKGVDQHTLPPQARFKGQKCGFTDGLIDGTDQSQNPGQEPENDVD